MAGDILASCLASKPAALFEWRPVRANKQTATNNIGSPSRVTSDGLVLYPRAS